MSTSTNNQAVTTNVSSSGRTYISGLASGINTQALITAGLAPYTAQETTLNTQISTNTAKISAYQALQSQITSLETALDALKSTANTADATNAASGSVTSVFGTKAVTYSTSDGSTATNDVTVTADGTATTGSLSIVVNQLAQAEQVTSAAQTSDTAALGYDGTFDISDGTNAAATITVSAGDSLQTLKNSINAQTATTGVSADILQVSSNSFKLILSGNQLNQTINVGNVTGDDVLTNLGVTDGSGDFNHISQTAQPAKFLLDNTLITGDSNTFNNVLTGVDISLQNAAPATTITANINNNVSGVSGAINSVITAYNSLYDTIHTNEVVGSDGTVDSTSEPLYGDPLLGTLSSQLKALLVANGNNTSGNNNSLGAIGITVGSDNHLAITNQTALNNALNNDFPDVQSLFSTQFTSSDSGLTVSTNNSNVNGSFTLNVTADNGGIVEADVNGANDFTINGTQLVGNAGTAYAGLTLNYTGAGGSINVNLQQGIADQLVTFLDSYNNTESGSIAQQISSIQNTDSSLQTQITQIKASSSSYENTLIDKYASMEAAIQKAQLAQQSINSIFGFTTTTTNAG